MPCYFPLDAWKLPEKLPSGKSRLVFKRTAFDFVFKVREHLKLPCGRCIGCRLERSRQWAVRLMHEAHLHERSCFLTLTFSDEFYPADGSLSVRTAQLFMKRLRKRFGYAKLRFFLCGEYGEKSGRAHYHVILFGEDFSDDRICIEESQSGFAQYSSPTLDRAWPYGRCTIGDVSFESAAYVARYSLKKILGPEAEAHYKGRKPEFVTMSRRPGIGSGWLDKYGLENTYNHDRVVMRGQPMLPPKFYDKLLEKADPVLYERVKQERRPDVPFDLHPDNTLLRRRVRAVVKRLQITKLLKRGVE